VEVCKVMELLMANLSFSYIFCVKAPDLANCCQAADFQARKPQVFVDVLLKPPRSACLLTCPDPSMPSPPQSYPLFHRHPNPAYAALLSVSEPQASTRGSVCGCPRCQHGQRPASPALTTSACTVAP